MGGILIMEQVKPKKSDDVTRERFKRLASMRTEEVLNRLRILGHCSNRQAYEYGEEEISKIFIVQFRTV